MVFRLIALAVLVALLSPSAAAAARPAAGASYLVKHRSYDTDRGSFLRENVLSSSASATAFGDSAPVTMPPSEFADPGTPNPPRSLPSVIEIGSRCLGLGNDSLTGYSLNGVPISPDGTFSLDIHNQPSDGYSGPKTSRAEFHLQGRFDTPTTVTGWLSEVRYLRVRDRPAFAGMTARTRRIVYCHTGKRQTSYRVPFNGRQRPIQWIVDRTCFLMLFPRC